MEGQSSVVETSCNDSVNGVLDVPGRLNTISWAYIQSILNKFCPGGTTSRLQSQFNSNHQSVKARTFFSFYSDNNQGPHFAANQASRTRINTEANCQHSTSSQHSSCKQNTSQFTGTLPPHRLQHSYYSIDRLHSFRILQLLS